jgi:hypothetical protein
MKMSHIGIMVGEMAKAVEMQLRLLLINYNSRNRRLVGFGQKFVHDWWNSNNWMIMAFI